LSDGRGRSIALQGRLGEAYSEDVFRHLLAIERRRSERSGRPFALLLVDLKPRSPGPSAPLHPLLARKLFEGLWHCLRETDFMGWYRAETVAGAVLTELPDGPEIVAPNNVAARVNRVLSEHLPSDIAGCLRLRMHLHGAPQAAGATHHTHALG
jgi:hypothetical protein